MAQLSYPLPEALSEEQLLGQLMGVPDQAVGKEPPRSLPDRARIHQELRRKGVSLRLLWEEYREVHPQGYGYSRFCELYGCWPIGRFCSR